MRTFRNPQGPGGTDVHIGTDAGIVVIAPGESVAVEFPDWQPCPDVLEEVGAPPRETQHIEAAPGVVDTPAPEPSPAEEQE